MAPVPINQTLRYWLNYTTGITQHTTQIRLPPTGNDAQALSFWSQFLGIIQPLLSDEFAVLGVQKAAVGTNVRFPVPPGGLSAFSGTDTDSPLPVDAPKEFTWVGRTTGLGRRWEMSFYGLQLGFPPDYRFEGVGMIPSLQDTIDLIEEFNGILVGIDGAPIVVYQYVNVNNNSYWEGEARKS